MALVAAHAPPPQASADRWRHVRLRRHLHQREEPGHLPRAARPRHGHALGPRTGGHRHQPELPRARSRQDASLLGQRNGQVRRQAHRLGQRVRHRRLVWRADAAQPGELRRQRAGASCRWTAPGARCWWPTTAAAASRRCRLAPDGRLGARGVGHRRIRDRACIPSGRPSRTGTRSTWTRPTPSRMPPTSAPTGSSSTGSIRRRRR